MTGELVISTVHHGNQPLLDTPSSVNYSLFFISSTHSLFYHPYQRCLSIFYTNTLNSNQVPLSWEVVATIPLSPPNITIHSVGLNNENNVLDLLTFELLDTPTKPCQCAWRKLTFSRPLGATNIEDVDQTLCCVFQVATVPIYSEFIGAHLMILCESKPIFEFGDEKEREIINEINKEEERDNDHQGIGYQNESERKYTWTQTYTDVTVSVSLPEDVTKRDIVCTIERDSLLVGLTDGISYIRGELWDKIDTDISTWIYTNNK